MLNFKNLLCTQNIKYFISSGLSTKERILTQSELSERIRQKYSGKKSKITKQSIKLIKKPVLNEEADTKLNELEKKSAIYESKVIGTAKVNIEHEKEFLKQASFKLRNEIMDETSRSHISKMESLMKTSTDPKHLTILNDGLNEKIRDLIEKNSKQPLDQELNAFIELNSGFGLLTKKFLNSNTKFKKFLLIESFSRFLIELQNLKNSNSNIDLQILRSDPFSSKFLYESNLDLKKNILNSFKTDNNLIKELNLTIYGILPWNSKDYLNRLFSNFCSDTGLFGLNRSKIMLEYVDLDLNINTPQFYLFIPEVLMAKIDPSRERKYSKYKSRLSVFSSILANVKVLTVEPIEYFFPYPIMSKMYKYQNLDNKKMYLVHIKFKEKSLVNDQKRLFYLFVNNLYCHRNEAYVRDCVRSVCTDVESLFDQVGLWKYTRLSQITPYQLMKMFNYLIDNQDLNQLKNLLSKSEENEYSLDRSNRNKELKLLKKINKNLSGQLILPNK